MKLNFYPNQASKNESPRIVLISSSSFKEGIVSALRAQGGIVQEFASLTDFFMDENYAYKHWHGVVVDLSTLNQLSQKDCDSLRSLDGAYPICLIRKSNNATTEYLCYVKSCSEIGGSIQEFYAYCLGRGPARKIRLQRRYELNLNVRLFPIHVAPREVDRQLYDEKTVTLNGSLGGLFVVTGQDYCEGDVVGLSIPVLGEEIIRGDVRWVKAWSESSLGVPGIGIQITEINAEQQALLEVMFSEAVAVQ